MVLSGGLIQFSIVHTNALSCENPSRNLLIILISYDHHSPFLRYYMAWAYPFTIKDRVDNTGFK